MRIVRQSGSKREWGELGYKYKYFSGIQLLNNENGYKGVYPDYENSYHTIETYLNNEEPKYEVMDVITTIKEFGTRVRCYGKSEILEVFNILNKMGHSTELKSDDKMDYYSYIYYDKENEYFYNSARFSSRNGHCEIQYLDFLEFIEEHHNIDNILAVEDLITCKKDEELFSELDYILRGFSIEDLEKYINWRK